MYEHTAIITKSGIRFEAEIKDGLVHFHLQVADLIQRASDGDPTPLLLFSVFQRVGDVADLLATIRQDGATARASVPSADKLIEKALASLGSIRRAAQE